MSLKPVHGIAIALVVVLVGILFYFKFGSKEVYTNTLVGGQVVSITADSIVVSGRIFSSDQKYSDQRNIEFKITSETIFKNKAVLITQEDIQSGKPFTPKMEEGPGAFGDFQAQNQVVINEIVSKENMFQFSDVTALEINYSLVNYEKP